MAQTTSGALGSLRSRGATKRRGIRHTGGKIAMQEGRDHCQFYTKSRLTRIFADQSLRLIAFGKSNSIFSISPRLSANQRLGEFDTRVTDRLPYWMASGWYFVFELGVSA